MAKITLDHIRHAYGPVKSPADYALKELDHVWTDGGAFALLGRIIFRLVLVHLRKDL